MSFTIKMVWNGNWCGIDMWNVVSTCTCWLPCFSVANNISNYVYSFQLEIIIEKELEMYLGKKGFLLLNVLETPNLISLLYEIEKWKYAKIIKNIVPYHSK